MKPRVSGRNQLGLSVVELMIGTAIGLFVVCGGMKLMALQIDSQRRLMLEARLHQDLRAASDVVARDLRRAGYWRGADEGKQARPGINPYQSIVGPEASGSSQITFSYSRDAVENNRIDGNESFGVRLRAGVVELLNGSGGWQQATDPAVVAVTALVITPEVRTVSLGESCSPACRSEMPGCPSMKLRQLRLLLQAHATGDAGVVREIRETVRLRNDELPTSACPT